MNLLMAIFFSAFFSTATLWAESDYSADDIQEIVPIDEPAEEMASPPPPTDNDAGAAESATEEFNY